LFAQAGNITSVNLIQDRESGQSKGFAYVTMDTQAEAQKAIGMFNAFSLADRALKVNAAQLREAPGGYQSRLNAFSLTGHLPKAKTSTPRQKPGGYQSQLSAFGKGGGPPPTRRRGSNHRP
jgi:RNA recognition motif-containing protein